MSLHQLEFPYNENKRPAMVHKIRTCTQSAADLLAMSPAKALAMEAK